MSKELWIPKEGIVIESINVHTKSESFQLGGGIPRYITLGYEINARVVLINLLGKGNVTMDLGTSHLDENINIQDVVIWHLFDVLCSKEHTIYTTWWGGSDHYRCPQRYT